MSELTLKLFGKYANRYGEIITIVRDDGDEDEDGNEIIYPCQSHHGYWYSRDGRRSVIIDGNSWQKAAIGYPFNLVTEITSDKIRKVQASMEQSPTIDNITEHRGSRYGTPLQNFVHVEQLYELWLKQFEACHIDRDEPTAEVMAVVKQAVHMIMTKIARAAYNPEYDDNWIDIGGYAKTVLMAFEEIKERDGE